MWHSVQHQASAQLNESKAILKQVQNQSALIGEQLRHLSADLASNSKTVTSALEDEAILQKNLQRVGEELQGAVNNQSSSTRATFEAQVRP